MEYLESDYQDKFEHKLWKKALCVFLAVIIGFGTFVTLTVGSSRIQDWLGVRTMLSAYAAEIVDTKGVMSANEEAMKDNNTIIDVENRDGSNTSYIFSEPISFVDENGNIKTKDISVEKQKDKGLIQQGYDYTNGQNDYRINFSSNSAKGVYVKSDEVSYYIIPQGKNVVEGIESTSFLLNEEFEVFEYPNIYGKDTSLKFYPQLNGIKDEIVLNKNIGENQFSFELKTENCSAVLNEDGAVTLVDNSSGETVQTFSAPFAYDSEFVEGEYDNHFIDCTYSLEETSENTYVITVAIDSDWLNSENTAYPVIIDPTTADITNDKDAGIYSAKAGNWYGKEVTACFGRASTYGYGRALNQFTIPAEIKKGATINSAYIWQRETTGRTTNTYVTPYLVTSAWDESAVTWNSRPTYTTSVSGTTKNINSASTDDTVDNNPYWYKFGIENIVKKWVDGEYTNNGIVFVSSEETNGNYNWRAFTTRQYSSSLMRPYTVINYTNDTTAPVASVSKSATEWTNDSVTVTINGACDSGAGLHGTPYSFSTINGTYSWTSSNSESYTSNCTVYIAVKDAIGNIRDLGAVVIDNIDTTAPTINSVNEENVDSNTKNVTINATDDESGIKEYSFDGGESWQTANNKEITGSYTVRVKDNSGNISAIDSTVDVPLIYHENNLVYLVSKNNNETALQYKIIDAATSETISDWYEYEDSIKIPVNKQVVVYARDSACEEKYTTLTCRNNIGIFEESVTDFSVSFFDAGFDFARYYSSVDNSWYYSINSAITVEENNALIKAKMPDNTVVIFTKNEYNEFVSKNYDCKLKLVYNDNEEFTGYVIESDDLSYGYDVNGLLAYVEDENGNRISITRTENTATVAYGPSNNQRAYIISYVDGAVSSVLTPNNETISYSYNNGNLTKVAFANDGMIIDREGGIILSEYIYTNGVMTGCNGATIEYNANGLISKITEKSGKYTTYTYPIPTDDSVALTVVATDQSNNCTVVNYDKALNTVEIGENQGEAVTSTTSCDNTVQYTYDENGNIVSDGTNTYKYDENGNLITEQGTDYTNSYEYNQNNDLQVATSTVTQTADSGEKTETTSSTYYKYNENGKVIKSFESTVEVSDEEFDTKFELAENKAIYTYDANGKLAQTVEYSADEKQSVVTTTVYEDNKQTVTTETTPKTDGTPETKTTVSVYVFDEFNNVSTDTTTDEDGETTTTTYTYDVLGRQLTSDDGETVVANVYDAAGNIVKQTSTTTKDSKTTTTITRKVYDCHGNLLQEITSDDNYNVNSDGLTSADTYSDKTIGMVYTYDGATGLLMNEKNQKNVVTTYAYENGVLKTETFDNNIYTYNANGDVTQVTVNGQVYATYTYNSKYKLTDLTYANGDSIQYQYDSNGNMTAQYKNGNTLPFVQMSYTQNDDGTYYMSSKTDNQINQRIQYNKDGEIEKIYRINDDKTETVIVNNTGNSQEINGYKLIITETNEGVEFKGTSPNWSHALSLDYANITADDSEDETYAFYYQIDDYDPDLRTTITRSYSDDSNSDSIQYTDDSGNLAYTYTTTYNDDGQVVSATRNDYSTSYTYDSDGRIIREDEQYVGYSAVYEYDSRGNITSKNAYDYTTGNIDESTIETDNGDIVYSDDELWIDGIDQIVVDESTLVDINYDVNGNPLNYTMDDTVFMSYEWDGRNLTSISTITEDTGELTKIAEFTYDENGMRTSKTYEGITTYYVYENGNLLSQYDMDSTGVISNVIMFLYDQSGEMIGMYENGLYYYYAKNPLGDVVRCISIAGTGENQYQYDAWGHNYYSSSSTNPIRYRGYYYDKGIGMYYLQSRYYEPGQGRFINTDDPTMLKQTRNSIDGLNLFAYCNNDPINNTDPTGKFSLSSIKSLVSKIISAIKIRLQNYLQSLIRITKYYVYISTGFMSSVIDAIVSSVVSGVIYKGITVALKEITKKIAKKAPEKVVSVFKNVVNTMETSGILKFFAKIIIKKAIGRSGFVGNLVKDMRTSMLTQGTRIVSRISSIVAIFSSFGGLIAFILDICDKKWDDTITIKRQKIKLITC